MLDCVMWRQFRVLGKRIAWRGEIWRSIVGWESIVVGLIVDFRLVAMLNTSVWY